MSDKVDYEELSSALHGAVDDFITDMKSRPSQEVGHIDMTIYEAWTPKDDNGEYLDVVKERGVRYIIVPMSDVGWQVDEIDRKVGDA